MRYTKDDWFAAASAHDLWGSSYLLHYPYVGLGTDICGASYDLYLKLLDAAEVITGITDNPNHSFIAAQLGCEKAGLA